LCAIGVTHCVIDRILRLNLLTVEVRASRPVHKYKVVKSDCPEDLVFQSVQKGLALRDNNILSRFLKPAGRTLGMPWVNWRCLRTSHAAWLKIAGPDVKDAQAQMRHRPGEAVELPDDYRIKAPSVSVSHELVEPWP
jgi:hypothetical protein